MNTKKLLSVLLLLFGEILIITCFLYFGQNLPGGVLSLDIIVTSIIYAIYFIGILIPKFDFNDKSHKVIGALGIRGFFAIIYTIAAIWLMVAFNNELNVVTVNTQVLVQAILFFLLCTGFYFASSALEKVQDVYIEEKQRSSRLDEIKNATKDVGFKLAQAKNAPQDIVSRFSAFQENLRFISPCNVDEAIILEENVLSEIRDLQIYIQESPLNHDKIIDKIKTCEIIYQERKKVYSN